MWLNYNETYAVSDNGLVMNRETGKVLKPAPDKGGYHRVDLQRKTKRVHRLVGLCFLPRIDLPNLEIDHVDGDKTNNDASNLRWCTRSVNNRNKPSSKNISYNTDNKYWELQFRKDGKNIYRKQFKTLEEATAARENFINSEEYRQSM